MDPNPVQAFLERGGVAWRRPISWFVERYGVSRCQWLDIDIVLVTDAARIVDGLLRPPDFHLRPALAPSIPPILFSGLIHGSPDWADSLAATQLSLTDRLGTAEAWDTSNTRGWRWRFGKASVSVTAWPPELQPPEFRRPGANFMNDRDPRTADATHLSINSGFRPGCSPRELSLIGGFAPIAALPAEARLSAALDDVPEVQHELEYLRAWPEGTDRLRNRIGSVGDLLILGRTELTIVPVAEAQAMRLLRLHPARGSGYSKAYLQCRSDAAGGIEKALTLGQHIDTSGLDQWARETASSLGLPLRIEDYPDD